MNITRGFLGFILIGIIWLLGNLFWESKWSNSIEDTTSNTKSNRAKEYPPSSLIKPTLGSTHINPDTTANSEEVLDQAKISIEARLFSMAQRRAGLSFDKKSVQEALKQEYTWNLSEDSIDNKYLTEKELADGRFFIESNPLRIESLMVGDSLSLNIPHTDEDFTLTVQNVIAKDSLVQWKGELQGSEIGSFTFTKGTSFIAGSVRTSTAIYEIEITDGKGWIHNASNLFVMEEGTTDSFIPTPE